VIILIIGILAAIAIPSLISKSSTKTGECSTKVMSGVARGYGSSTEKLEGTPRVATVGIAQGNHEVSWETHNYKVTGLYFWRPAASEEKPVYRGSAAIQEAHAEHTAKISLGGLLSGSITRIQLCLQPEKSS